MKKFLSYSLLCVCFVLKAQDKVYLLDGGCKSGKITEISGDNITLEADNTELIPRETILLLEFKNGMVELINKPGQAVIYTTPSTDKKRKPAADKDLFLSNVLSINTLALCNADIAAFYERILPKKKIGTGVMGAYNFNRYAGIQNLSIALLNNSKKNYDIGVFANYYVGLGFSKISTFHWGIMFKYLNFSYSKVIEEKVTSGGQVSTNIKYTPATGSQLATIFTFGTHTPLSKSVFLKSIVGLGGFNLRGDYKQQYNYYLNNVSTTTTPGTTLNRGFLLKLYLGLNVGYNF